MYSIPPCRQEIRLKPWRVSRWNGASAASGAALLGACAAGLLSLADIQGPLAPQARLAAEPDPAAVAFHTERHARFRRIVTALKPARLSAGEVTDCAGGTA